MGESESPVEPGSPRLLAKNSQDGLTPTVREFFTDKDVERTQSAFLKALANSSSVTRACMVARVQRGTVKRWMQEDPGFMELVADAYETATDALEEVARRRAMTKSDNLLTFLLRGYRRQKFGDAGSVVSQIFNVDNKPVIDVSKLSNEELEALSKIADKLGLKAHDGPAPEVPAP